jgi:adenylate kinase family enzyme
MQRILVIGSPGSGKSTLARRLANRLSLPLIHLDREFFGPGWTEPTRSEWRDRVAALAARSEWIMDGNYRSTFDLRVPRATAILWLDIPRWRCLANVLWRVLRYYGRVRPDLGPACIERFNWPFLRWIWLYPRNVRPETVRMLECERSRRRVFELRSRAEMSRVEDELALCVKAA